MDRVASALKDPAHLYPLHALLFTVPGVPSVYDGSEWGIAGDKAGRRRPPAAPAPPPAGRGSGAAPGTPTSPPPSPASPRIRRGAAPCAAAYRPLHVAAEQLAFARELTARPWWSP